MSTRRNPTKWALCHAAVLALTMTPTLAVFAEEASPEAETSIAEQAQSEASELEEQANELTSLRERFARNQDNIAANALRAELTQQEKRFRRELAALIKLVVQVEGQGADAGQARELAQRLLGEEAERLRTDSRALEGETLELTQVVHEGSPEEAKAARTERNGVIIKANELLRQLQDNIEQRQALGLDVDDDETFMKERLKTRSTFVAGYLKSTTEELEALRAQPGVEENGEAQKTMIDLRNQRDVLAESQRLYVTLMNEYDMDTSALRRGIISATGKLSEDVLDKDVALGLVEESLDDAKDWVRAHGVSLAFQAFSFVLILLAFWVAAKIGRGAMRRALARSRARVSGLAKEFFVKTTGRLILLLGFIIAVAQLGVEVAPLLAGLGIAGFVVGFALQDTLSNFAAGMMILMYRPFDVGDVIEGGGVSGKVHQMNLVSTMVLTFDNQLLMVPNKKIWGDVIRNVTHRSTRRVDLTFGIGYSDDVDKAEKVLGEIVSAHAKVLADPAPIVRLHELGDSSVDFVVRPWALADDYWDVYWDVTREVKRRFDEEGISIPFPQRDVHIYREPAPQTGETRAA